MNRFFRLLAAVLLLPAAFARAGTVKDKLLTFPYALKPIGVAALTLPAAETSGWHVASLGVAGVAIPDLLVLGALAFGTTGQLRTMRRVAYWSEMAAGSGMILIGMGQLQGGRGGEIGLAALAYALPLLLLAQLDHIPFDAEDGGEPPRHVTPMANLTLPF